MNKTLSERLQERLNSHFDSFRTIKQRGWNFQTMPRKHEVPCILQSEYDRSRDTFRVMFAKDIEDDRNTNGNIHICQSKDGDIVGLVILNCRRSSPDTLREELKSDFKHEITKWHNADDLTTIVHSDTVRRQFAFFSELIHMLPALLKWGETKQPGVPITSRNLQANRNG